MEKLLTIVIPVYKVEKYINKCLDSCVIRKSDGSLDEEKMSRLEVIIVNDGTPDRSAEFSREYTVKYPGTFRQIDKENGGHGSAWNVGLKEAKGKYLRFLDSDDWLVNLDRLMDVLEQSGEDLVFTDYHEVDETTARKTEYKVNAVAGVRFPLTQEMIRRQNHLVFVLNFWTTTYKTSILQGQWPLFAEHCMYDDSILAVAPILQGRSCMYCDFPLYQYLVGRAGQSMSAEVIKRNVNSYFVCYQRMAEWYETAGLSDIPDDLMQVVRSSVTHYAKIAFGNSVYLPIREARARMREYYPLAYSDPKTRRTRMAARYEKLPFALFYVLERIRICRH